MTQPSQNPPKQTRSKPRRKNFGRRIGDGSSGGSVWLISFTDIMALMLTFFVLLFAMSNPENQEWDDLKETLNNQFNRFYGQVLNRGTQEAVNLDRVDFSQALDLNYLYAVMTEQISRQPELERVRIITMPQSLVLSLPEDLLFEPGKAEVRQGGSKALFALGGSLERIKNRIEIIGHTDPRPVTPGGAFSSNWALSAARAASVAGVLKDVGYEKNIIVRGHASGRYRDLSSDMEEEKRMELSRRVDIVVMEDDGKTLKLFDIGWP